MLPRRAVVALSATAIAVALLLNFKTPQATVSGLTGVTGGTVAVGRPAATGGTAAGATVGSAGATSQAPSASSGSTGSTGSASGGNATSASLKSGTFTGSTVNTPFGPVQVQVTVSGGRVVDVQAVQTPNSHGRSVMIAQYATPILRQEALAAQSAQIDIVSGATYTSQGYAQSLQSALDQAHA